MIVRSTLRQSGTLANRPPANTAQNSRYYATDNSTIYASRGDTWIKAPAAELEEVENFASGTLGARPAPGTMLGWIYTDTGTGSQYEAFPTAWAAVPAQAVGGPGGAVTTVFTRTGDIVAANGDYSMPQITGGQAALDQIAANAGALASLTLDVIPGQITQAQLPDTIAFTDVGESGPLMFDVVSGQTVMLKTLRPAALTGDAHDYTPAGLGFVDEANPGAFTIEIDCGGTSRDLTGIGLGVGGRMLRLVNVSATGAEILTLRNQNTGSTVATNRIVTPLAQSIIVRQNSAVLLIYAGGSTNRWRAADSAVVNTTVTAGTYTNMNAVVSSDGRIQSASNGSAAIPRIATQASNATWSPNADTTDVFELTAQVVPATTIANPVFTSPVHWQRLEIVVFSAAAQALTWSGSQWAASSDLVLPLTTTAGKRMVLGFKYHATAAKWYLLAKLDNL